MQLELGVQQRRLADIALASGDWQWGADAQFRVRWGASHLDDGGSRGVLTSGGVYLSLAKPVNLHALSRLLTHLRLKQSVQSGGLAVPAPRRAKRVLS